MEETPLCIYKLILWSHLGVLGVLYGTMACSSCGVTLYTNQKYSKKSETVYNINIRASPPTRTHASFCQKTDALAFLDVSHACHDGFLTYALTFPLRFFGVLLCLFVFLYLFLLFLLFVFNEL